MVRYYILEVLVVFGDGFSDPYFDEKYTKCEFLGWVRLTLFVYNSADFSIRAMKSENPYIVLTNRVFDLQMIGLLGF